MAEPGGDDLDAAQTITMSTRARQRLRATAVVYDISHGPFARVLLAAVLDRLETDEHFRDQIARDVEAEKQRYRRS